jgi:hypothetical protein
MSPLGSTETIQLFSGERKRADRVALATSISLLFSVSRAMEISQREGECKWRGRQVDISAHIGWGGTCPLAGPLKPYNHSQIKDKYG